MSPAIVFAASLLLLAFVGREPRPPGARSGCPARSCRCSSPSRSASSCCERSQSSLAPPEDLAYFPASARQAPWCREGSVVDARAAMNPTAGAVVHRIGLAAPTRVRLRRTPCQPLSGPPRTFDPRGFASAPLKLGQVISDSAWPPARSTASADVSTGYRSCSAAYTPPCAIVPAEVNPIHAQLTHWRQLGRAAVARQPLLAGEFAS